MFTSSGLRANAKPVRS